MTISDTFIVSHRYGPRNAESRWANPGCALPSRCPSNASDSGMLRRIHSTSRAGKMPTANRRPPRDRFGQNGVQAGVDERRQAGADGRAGLHEADAAAAILVADDLTHQYRAGGPFTTEAEPMQAAQDEQLLEVLREAAQEGEDRIPQYRDLQHAHAAEAVCERA